MNLWFLNWVWKILNFGGKKIYIDAVINIQHIAFKESAFCLLKSSIPSVIRQVCFFILLISSQCSWLIQNVVTRQQNGLSRPHSAHVSEYAVLLPGRSLWNMTELKRNDFLMASRWFCSNPWQLICMFSFLRLFATERLTVLWSHCCIPLRDFYVVVFFKFCIFRFSLISIGPFWQKKNLNNYTHIDIWCWLI